MFVIQHKYITLYIECEITFTYANLYATLKQQGSGFNKIDFSANVMYKYVYFDSSCLLCFCGYLRFMVQFKILDAYWTLHYWQKSQSVTPSARLHPNFCRFAPAATFPRKKSTPNPVCVQKLHIILFFKHIWLRVTHQPLALRSFTVIFTAIYMLFNNYHSLTEM